MEEQIRFRIRLAGITFDVACLYESTQRYCADYLTDAPADHSITVTPEDISRERARLLSKKEPGQPLEASTPQALEVLFLCRQAAQLLPEHDRVLFHGSCLALDGTGVLFTAKSGTGKSTHTRLWREVFGDRVVMVNDDKPFLHITPEGVAAWGTPWRGKHGLGGNITAPLKAVCILCRGTENRIEPVTAREALPMLLQQTYAPETSGAMLQTLRLVQQLSQTVPVYRLYCNMDPEAALTARSGMNI